MLLYAKSRVLQTRTVGHAELCGSAPLLSLAVIGATSLPRLKRRPPLPPPPPSRDVAPRYISRRAGPLRVGSCAEHISWTFRRSAALLPRVTKTQATCSLPGSRAEENVCEKRFHKTCEVITFEHTYHSLIKFFYSHNNSERRITLDIADTKSQTSILVTGAIRNLVLAALRSPSEPPVLAIAKPKHGHVASNVLSLIPAPRVENNLMGPVKQSHLVINKEVMKKLRTTDYLYTETERVREKRAELPPTRLATDTLNKEMFKTVTSNFDNVPQNFTANKLRPGRSCYPSLPTEDEFNRIEPAESLIESQAEGDFDDEPFE
ncbi:unnamed protein product [Trichogramma brassicae]|uniref:Uncharacterized protein n=1 Tax=Trichogramma brassicae TaxID=86971 RepID=A0A6H5IV05_9HYME|nr:unnamed protein product [Trichogramma brassicae]